jgi:hypothetical protein
MQITNKAATVMFTGKGWEALNRLSPGAQYLKDSKISIGALKLKEQAVKSNGSLASQSILFSPKVEQIIESIITGRIST